MTNTIDESVSVSALVARISLYEEKRKLQNQSVILRNTAYWRELQMMQKESFLDTYELVLK